MSSQMSMPTYTGKFDWAHVTQTGEIPDGMYLFQDSMPLKIINQKLITESVGGKKQNILRLTGVFQRADEKNQNGRIYPYDVLKDAVENMQEAIENRRVMGEFDHPPDAKIHMDRVAHLLTRLWMDNKVVYGELEVINDSRCPCGSQLACFIERGIQVGISSRGVGDMEITMREGEEAYEVQSGFHFVTFDAVAEPSVVGSQLMVMESLQRKRADSMRIRERELLKGFHNWLAN